MLKVKKASLAGFRFSHCNAKYYKVVEYTYFIILYTFRFSEEVKCFTKVRPSISVKMIIIRTVYIISSLLVFFARSGCVKKLMFNGRMIEGEGWMQQMSEGENSL